MRENPSLESGWRLNETSHNITSNKLTLQVHFFACLRGKESIYVQHLVVQLL